IDEEAALEKFRKKSMDRVKSEIIEIQYLMLLIKNIVAFFLISFFVFSCKTSENQEDIDVSQNKGKGGVVYGGTLRVNETEPISSLFPHLFTDLVSSHVASQIYEGLVKFNAKDLSILPALAESWSVNQDGTIYTFKLKKGVFFHDDVCFPNGQGREFNAQDVKYSFERLATWHPDNAMFAATIKKLLKGANDYYEASVSKKPDFEFEGVKVIDEYTVEFHLEAPSSSFLYTLANPCLSIFPKEAYEKYGNLTRIGTGPFMFLQNNNSDGTLILVKNPKYHKKDTLGNQLPFIDTLIYTFISSKKAELEEFQKGNLDIIIGLPSESIKDVVETQIADFQNRPPKFILDRSPELATQFYEFNTVVDIFKNKKVRQAISYAIDRDKIVDDILKGEAYGPGIYGITPPSLRNYDVSSIKGYKQDKEKAKKLLADAGYPNGKGFPSIKLVLNSGGSKNTNVALEIQKQLRDVLNINLELEIVPLSVKLEESRMGRGDMFRSAWIADFPSAENFLLLTYGKTVPKTLNEPSWPNVSRFVNTQFDELYEKALITQNQEEKNKLLIQAEQLMMDEAPLLILWYDEKYRMYQARVNNFYSNPLNYWDFSSVYLKAPSVSEERK
ncbi:MAG: ABC transporter substrate-binding protein, partial [Bacteroidia bacterium]